LTLNVAAFQNMQSFHSRGGADRAMKLVAEHLEDAANFARMAAGATDPLLKASLEQQAVAYRKLAEKRSAQLTLPPVNLPAVVEPPQKGD
jgi:hypothetical protein